MFTEPSNCIILNGTCMRHGPTRMLQIVSIKLVKIAMDGPIMLYGYIALRDNLDPLLNYVVKFSRDDPRAITLEQVHFYTYLQSLIVMLFCLRFNPIACIIEIIESIYHLISFYVLFGC